jgi:hypothetical protein
MGDQGPNRQIALTVGQTLISSRHTGTGLDRVGGAGGGAAATSSARGAETAAH